MTKKLPGCKRDTGLSTDSSVHREGAEGPWSYGDGAPKIPGGERYSQQCLAW